MHHRAKDITGLRVGYLTAIRYMGSNGKKSLWEVRCDCGVLKLMDPSDLKKQKARGIVASCGCMRRASIAKRRTTHGMSKHPAFAVWRSMLARCERPSHQAWKNYGGRGISVCERWHQFEDFWADMGPSYRAGLSLERVDNSQGYSPENCEWVTPKAQAANTRKTVILQTPDGPMPLGVAADHYGVKRSTLAYRLDHGWPLLKALNLCST